ncbi:MAG: TraR/DksA family transcriptional regulator [Lentisphaerae bacterium]|nr:TraR/DksA family transcriptional regulator [Lentisphaerota bacterium]
MAKNKTATSSATKKKTDVPATPKKSVKSATSSKTAKATAKSKAAKKTFKLPPKPAESPLPWLNKTTQRKNSIEKVPVIKLTAKLKKEFNAQLIAMRDELNRQLQFFAAHNISRSKSDTEIEYHNEEQGTDNFNRDFALNRVSSVQEIIILIDQALNRIKEGGFGVCEGCENGIESERIKALPYATMCISCQSAAETGKRYIKPFNTGNLFAGDEDDALPLSNDDE